MCQKTALPAPRSARTLHLPHGWAILKLSMSNPAPKPEDLLSQPGEDEEDMTSIMSSDQRKQLQQAAATSKEADTLERDTAKPPSSAAAEAAAAEIAIPKPPATPSLKTPVVPSKVDVKVAPAPEAKAEASAPVKVAPATPAADMATWELVAFVLLAVAVAIALKM